MHRRNFLIAAAALALTPWLGAQTANLYTKPVAGAGGGLTGKVGEELTHAIALNRDRTQCFRAQLSDGGKAFSFTGLPTGKYDLVLITKAGTVYEGLGLGAKAVDLTEEQKKNIAIHLNKADSFFNKWKLHRAAVEEDGEKLVCFIERMRDKEILRQSGEALGANLRRFEVATLVKAQADWDFSETRHIYREEQPLGVMNPLKHVRADAIGNLRVIDTPKDLGAITLP